MTVRACLFPGQGSQFVGMAKMHLKRADSILDFKLSEIIEKGPEARLAQTENAQPAIFFATLERFQRLGDCAFDFYLGHSVGELSALCAAGFVSFEQGLLIARNRGLCMRYSKPFKMAAVTGIQDVPLDVPLDLIACYNSSDQIVISGDANSIDECLAKIKSFRLLNVSAPFHSALMRDAADKFGLYLDTVQFSHSDKVVIANCDLEAVL